jgi:hypothetical protein
MSLENESQEVDIPTVGERLVFEGRALTHFQQRTLDVRSYESL